jgi:hypothetical protein
VVASTGGLIRTGAKAARLRATQKESREGLGLRCCVRFYQTTGPPSQLEQAIGSDVLGTLSQQTGLSREEILSRLSKNLPDAVDKYTPDGRVPTVADFSRS